MIGSIAFAIEGTNYIQEFNATTLKQISFLIPPSAPNGIASAGGDLYVTYGTTIEKMTTGGQVLASYTEGAGLTLGALTITDGKVFVIEGTNYVQAFDANTLKPIDFFIPAGAPTGIASDGDSLFVTYGTTLERVSFDGTVLATDTLPAGFNLTGVTVTADTAVPEPAGLAMFAFGLTALCGLVRRPSIARSR